MDVYTYGRTDLFVLLDYTENYLWMVKLIVYDYVPSGSLNKYDMMQRYNGLRRKEERGFLMKWTKMPRPSNISHTICITTAQLLCLKVL